MTEIIIYPEVKYRLQLGQCDSNFENNLNVHIKSVVNWQLNYENIQLNGLLSYLRRIMYSKFNIHEI